MDFQFSIEQQLLRQSLSAFLNEHYNFSHRQAVSRSVEGWDCVVWASFARQLGLLGAGIRRDSGGSGGDPVDIMVIMEELGAGLVLEPFLESAVLSAHLLQAAGGREADLAALVSGEAIFIPAWTEAASRYSLAALSTHALKVEGGWRLEGRKSVVIGAASATHFLIPACAGEGPDGAALFLVPAQSKGLRLETYPTIDGRRAGELHLENLWVADAELIAAPGLALALMEGAQDAAIAAVCAEAVGVMRRMLQDTLDYTSQRRQFDQPLSGFQVVQHRLADMYMHIEKATSAVYLATLSLGEAERSRRRAVSIAKVTTGKAMKFVGQNAIQLHGGMGMTDELGVGHGFRRLTVIEGQFGTTGYHKSRFAQLSSSIDEAAFN